MRIKINDKVAGLHPSEVVVSVETRSGKELLIVDKRILHDDHIDVGYPVGTDTGYYLVELPRETLRGTWRVWVRRDLVLPDLEKVA